MIEDALQDEQGRLSDMMQLVNGYIVALNDSDELKFKCLSLKLKSLMCWVKWLLLYDSCFNF